MTEAMARQASGRPGQVSRLFSAAVGMTVICALAISFAISFAAFVYSGPLPSHLSTGVGLSLLGVIAMPVIAAFTASYRGGIFHAQDIPAVLLGGAAVGMTAQLGGESYEAFASVATLVGVATLATAAALFAASRFRLGLLARFMPYPVIGGFLAASGFLLVMGALSMMVKAPLSIWDPAPLWEAGAVARWGPWLVFSAVTVAAVRLSGSALMLPLALLLGALGFYGMLWAAGIDLATASDRGLLLGPFEGEGFLDGISAEIPLRADWGLILQQAPSVAAIAGVTVLGLLLNASGLEVALERDIDLDRELKSGALANLAAGVTGGFPGFHLVGETLLAAKTGITGVAGSIAVALAAAVTLCFGASLVAVFPIGLAAAVVTFLGIDMLYEWLWVQRRRLPLSDMAIIGLILVTAAALGFVEALCVGLLAAALMFVVSYAGIDVVRLRTDGAVRRSTVERGVDHAELLADLGRGTRIYQLGGFLFFGTANRLLDSIRAEFEAPDRPRRVVFDLSRVAGLDSSAALALLRIGDLCRSHEAELVLCGCSQPVMDRLAASGLLELAAVRETLDDALTQIEARLLEGAAAEAQERTVTEAMAQAAPGLDLSAFTERQTLEAGETLIAEGTRATTMYEVTGGQLRAEVTGPGGARKTVGRFLPGALIGEIAAYADVPRTATIVAERRATLVKISMEKIPETDAGRAAAAALHRDAARRLAVRLMRMTDLVRNMGA